jgi:hypothetical protein
MHAASPVVWEARAVCLRAGMVIVIFIAAWIKTGWMVLVCNSDQQSCISHDANGLAKAAMQ